MNEVIVECAGGCVQNTGRQVHVGGDGMEMEMGWL